MADDELTKSILRQYDELKARHFAIGDDDYNKDRQYRAVVGQLRDATSFVPAMIECGNSEAFLREAHRSQIIHVEGRLCRAVPGSTEQVEAALLLCQQRGLIATANDLDTVNELGESPLIEVHACGDGGVVCGCAS